MEDLSSFRWLSRRCPSGPSQGYGLVSQEPCGSPDIHRISETLSRTEAPVLGPATSLAFRVRARATSTRGRESIREAGLEPTTRVSVARRDERRLENASNRSTAGKVLSRPQESNRRAVGQPVPTDDRSCERGVWFLRRRAGLSRSGALCRHGRARERRLGG
jgi:hypothetical protein